ncbi:copper resistance protein CopC [Nocardioidaceae bacterium]|nr:copper resistance protein CopC [Nocardioidaceae bacterium]
MRVAAGLGLAAATVAVVGASSPAAYAHGDFETGSPGPGDAIAAGSTTLTLQFVDIDPGSRAVVELSETGGEVQPVGAALVLPDAATVCARTEPLDPGIYTVAYRLDSPDGAVAESAYVFEVVDGAAEDPLAAGPCADTELRPAGMPAVSTADSGSVAPLIATGAAVSVVVVGGIVVALRRRQSPEA